MEAFAVIQLNDQLRDAFPKTQFIWHPSTSGNKYTSNFEWLNCRNEDLITQMKEHHTDAELIQLTLINGYVYYK